MRKFSVFLIVVGLIFIIACLFFFRSATDVVDSKPMTITPWGNMTSEWPLFIGIIMAFVGGTFYYASRNDKQKVVR